MGPRIRDWDAVPPVGLSPVGYAGVCMSRRCCLLFPSKLDYYFKFFAKLFSVELPVCNGLRRKRLVQD